ncbi:MAG TPA: hypothetical protein VNO50_09830 [Pyrinomonadaceae bacterium]|nr:hypothetical protein [Pyrinomonadaceae bacterium]
MRNAAEVIRYRLNAALTKVALDEVMVVPYLVKVGRNWAKLCATTPKVCATSLRMRVTFIRHRITHDEILSYQNQILRFT